MNNIYNNVVNNVNNGFGKEYFRGSNTVWIYMGFSAIERLT
jgi:hypothetical protein